MSHSEHLALLSASALQSVNPWREPTHNRKQLRFERNYPGSQWWGGEMPVGSAGELKWVLSLLIGTPAGGEDGGALRHSERGFTTLRLWPLVYPPSHTHSPLLASPSPHPSFFCSYGAMPAHSKVGILLWPCSTKHLHTLIRILICSALFLPFSFRHSGRYTRITLHRVLTLIIFSTTSVLEGSCGWEPLCRNPLQRWSFPVLKTCHLPICGALLARCTATRTKSHPFVLLSHLCNYTFGMRADICMPARWGEEEENNKGQSALSYKSFTICSLQLGVFRWSSSNDPFSFSIKMSQNQNCSFCETLLSCRVVFPLFDFLFLIV